MNVCCCLLINILLLIEAETWPVFDSSTIELAGLFSDPENASESQSTVLSIHSRAMFKSAIILAQQNNLTIAGQPISWQTVQTSGNFITGLYKLCSSMLNTNIIGIVGPAYSREAHVIANFAQFLRIPTISYAATNPALSDRNSYPTFYRTIPSDTVASIAITELFVRYNWTSCIVIYQSDEFGSGGNEAMQKKFNELKLTIQETIVFDLSTMSLRGDLEQILLGSPARIVILWVFEEYTPLILNQAIQHDLVGPRFTWILRSNVSLETLNKTVVERIIGLLVIESTSSHIVNEPFNDKLLETAQQIWQSYEPETYPQSNHIHDYALYAFDATWTLILALHRLCSSESCFQLTNDSSCYSPRFINTSLLFETIDETQFLGVSGPIRFSCNTTDRTDGVYFLLQNIQSFENGIAFTPVLQWSYSTQWTTYTQAHDIIWPGNTSQPPSGSAGLQQVQLHICVIQSAPFTMSVDDFQRNTTKLIGYIPDLIEILQEKTGLIADIDLVSTNQTYDGLIQLVVNGICDLAMGDLTVTSKRNEIVDFSNSIFDNSLRILIRKTATADVDLFSYFRPFSGNLWLVLLLSTICAAGILCFIERKENDALNTKSLISSVAMSMWYSIGTIMGYGADFEVRTAAGRLLSVGLYLLSLVLVATYTANLASDLTITKTTDIITGIEDIKNGKIPFTRIGLLTGTSVVDYYLREISHGNRNFYSCYTNAEIYQRLLNGSIDASILDAALAEYAASYLYCDQLITVGIDFSLSAFAIAMQKNWIYAQDLDVTILLLRETGVLDNLRKKWFQTNICKTREEIDDESLRISIQSMGGLFFTFAVICILSIFLFAWTKRVVCKQFLFTSIGRRTIS